MNTAFVVILGMGTVFAGLTIIIVLCKLMSLFVSTTEAASDTTPVVSAAPAAPQAPAVVQNKQEVLAAISAVVSEELGTDISNIRIHSIKRV